MQEIYSIVKNMRSNAALGPDGLNAAFYKSSWDWIGMDVLNLITSFYLSGSLRLEINNTHIVLIPKVNAPISPKDYRPISLCNVAYKIIAKSRRHIASNIIIAQEIIHSFNLKTWN